MKYDLKHNLYVYISKYFFSKRNSSLIYGTNVLFIYIFFKVGELFFNLSKHENKHLILTEA